MEIYTHSLLIVYTIMKLHGSQFILAVFIITLHVIDSIAIGELLCMLGWYACHKRSVIFKVSKDSTKWYIYLFIVVCYLLFLTFDAMYVLSLPLYTINYGLRIL